MKPTKLTKSKYTCFMQCPKKAWYEEFKKKKVPSSTSATNGIKIGELARELFDNVCLFNDKSNSLSIPGSYAECPLKFDNLYCACDILVVREDKKVDIYEVKSTSIDDEDEEENEDEVEENGKKTSKQKSEEKYLFDLSFQYYLAIKNGLIVNSINLININKKYIHDGSDIHSKKFLNSFFVITNYTNKIKKEFLNVENNIKNFFELDSEKEPNCVLASFCKKNDGCTYLDECKEYKGLPKNNSVFDLYYCRSTFKYIEDGLLDFKQLYTNEVWDKLSEYNKRMIAFSLLDIKDPYINKTDLKQFVKKIKFPIYFFDFETASSPLPLFVNSRPYQQIPFQYSLHVMNTSSDTMDEIKQPNHHHEYLGDGKNDPRKELIEKMINQLSKKGSIVAYNCSFEKSRIKELARDFPEYSKQLLPLLDRFVDLEDVFKFRKSLGNHYHKKRTTDDKGNQTYKEVKDSILTSMVYLKGFYNSVSIKSVLPTLYPNNPEFDYSKLSQVHNGKDATESYFHLAEIKDEAERNELRENMLKYCCLDTYAMVAIYFKLKEYLTL